MKMMIKKKEKKKTAIDVLLQEDINDALPPLEDEKE